MKDIIDQAKHYRTVVRRAARAHYKAVDQARRGNLLLGVPVVVTTTVVGTSIFATLNSQPSATLKILAGIVSLLAAALAALQTFFRFAERAEKHRVAAANYGIARRDLDLFLLKYVSEPADARQAAIDDLGKIKSKLDQLAQESPDIPPRAYDAAVKELEAASQRSSPMSTPDEEAPQASQDRE